MGVFDKLGNWGAKATTSESETEVELDASQVMVGGIPLVLPNEIAEHFQEEVKAVEEARESWLDAQGQLEVRLRELEDVGWSRLNDVNLGPSGVKDLPTEARQARNREAERVWREDPVVGRAVETINEYVWGKGLPKPRAVDKRVQRLISSLWADKDNQACITAFESQLRKGTELQLYGELFITVFDQGTWGDLDVDPIVDGDTGPTAPVGATSPLLPPSENPALGGVTPTATGNGFGLDEDDGDLSGLQADVPEPPEPPPPPSAVKLASIHPNEIVDLIPDEENVSVPRFYKRQRVKRRYNFAKGTWEEMMPSLKPGETLLTEYYEDLRFPPAEDQPFPAASQMGDGRILHIAVNNTSFNLRGNSEVWRAVRWAKALNDFFTWRLTLLRALATFAFRKKVKGGASQVQQAANRSIASPGWGGTGAMGAFDPAAPPLVGAVLTENQNEQLDQFKTASGAGEAEADGKMLKSQVGVGMGLPLAYLGDPGDANLSNLSAIETPVLKMMEARQQLFQDAITKIIDFAIQKAVDEDALPEDVDRSFYVDMPSILERNVPEMVAALTNTTARLDPFATDVKLKRLTLNQVLLWLGFPDPDAITRKIYPKSMDNQPPAQPGVPAAPGGQPDGSTGAPTFPGNGATAGAVPGANGQVGDTGAQGPPPSAVQAYPGARTGSTLENLREHGFTDEMITEILVERLRG